MSPVPGLDRVGLLGGGVIGGGWAARFLLNGVDVQLFDPDPEAPRKVSEVVDNARRAVRRLVSAPLPAEGTLVFVDTPEAAADGVDFVQESAPERLELKQHLLQRASRAAGPEVVFGSSTSGLLPTEMQQGMRYPERLVVGHPFNPVYLMPLVEVVGGALTCESTRQRAAAVYEQMGMQPVHLSTEVDGFVADRLMEALWREALWMINDGVATATEIDDCMRYGPGLRWSFMGTFLTYRIAGGEAGMRHFMAQFGPSLKWPWSKLTDVPELTDALLDTLVGQSDEQAAGRSIRELERQRDDSLVAVFHGLRAVGNGAGLVLDRYEQLLSQRAATAATALPPDPQHPLRVHDVAVPAEWVDYNNHMNDSRYFQLSSETVDRFLRLIGMDDAYLAGGHSWFTVESHLNFVGQARLGDRLYATVQVLSSDDKRVRLFTAMHRADDDALLASAEHMLLHVDTRVDSACPAAPAMQAAIAEIARQHADLPSPANAGRSVGQRRA